MIVLRNDIRFVCQMLNGKCVLCSSERNNNNTIDMGLLRKIDRLRESGLFGLSIVIDDMLDTNNSNALQVAIYRPLKQFFLGVFNYHIM